MSINYGIQNDQRIDTLIVDETTTTGSINVDETTTTNGDLKCGGLFGVGYATAVATLGANITIPDGVSVFNITGTPGGAFNLVAPTNGSAGDILLVVNNSDNASGGLTIASGARATLFHNGVTWG